MSEWSKQSEEMFKSWESTQRQLLQNWRDNLERLNLPQDSEVWKESIQNWQDTAEKSFQAQLDMTHSWMENLSSLEGLPEQAQTSVARFREMSDQWVKTQSELWGNWFEMMKNFEPSTITDNWMEMYKDSLSTWQKATDNILDAQSAWWKSWAGSQAESEEES